MSKRELVDPVRIFDAKGRSILSYEKMERTIKLQQMQIDRLLRMLRARAARDPDVKPEQPIVH